MERITERYIDAREKESERVSEEEWRKEGFSRWCSPYTSADASQPLTRVYTHSWGGEEDIFEARMTLHARAQ